MLWLKQPLNKGKHLKEFKISESKESFQFKVGGDIFTCVPPCELPAFALIKYAETVAIGRLLAAHTQLFTDVLEPDSQAVFSKRLESKTEPITLSAMVEISNWLVQEIYSGKAKGLL